MHMISKKDLSKAEMDTLTKSCSPTIVITANGEVQTQEEAIVYVKELDIFLTMKVLENTPAVLSLGKLCDENGYSYEWINGQKPHLIKDGIRIICNTENFVPIVVPGLTSSSSTSSSSLRTPIKQENHSSSSSSSSSPSSPTVGDMSVREREDASISDISPVPVSELVDDRTGEPVETQANQIPKPNKKETTIERSNLCDDPEIPEWLQEFKENLVDDEIPLQGGSHASSSHEASLEPTTKRREELGKHSVYTHFLEDRNCQICQRTKITRAPCTRRNGEAVPRADNFGDLITADHKVLSDNCESRNNHRYAIVVRGMLLQFFNLVLHWNTVPAAWKISTVVPTRVGSKLPLSASSRLVWLVGCGAPSRTSSVALFPRFGLVPMSPIHGWTLVLLNVACSRPCCSISW